MSSRNPQLLEPTGDPPLYLQAEHFPVQKLNGTFRRIGTLTERPVYCKLAPDGSGNNICLWNYRNIWTLTKLTDLGKSNIYARSKDISKDPSKLKERWKVYHDGKFRYVSQARFKASSGPRPTKSTGAIFEDRETAADDFPIPALNGGWHTVAPLRPPPLSSTALARTTAREDEGPAPQPLDEDDDIASPSLADTLQTSEADKDEDADKSENKLVSEKTDPQALAPSAAASTLNMSFNPSTKALALGYDESNTNAAFDLRPARSTKAAVASQITDPATDTRVEIGTLVKVVSKAKKHEAYYSKVGIVRGIANDGYKVVFFHRFDCCNLTAWKEADLEPYDRIDLRDISVKDVPASPRNSDRSDASSAFTPSVNEDRGDEYKERDPASRNPDYERSSTMGVRRDGPKRSPPLRATVPRNMGSSRNQTSTDRLLADFGFDTRRRAKSAQDFRERQQAYPDEHNGIIKQGLLLKRGGWQNKVYRRIQKRHCRLEANGKFSYFEAGKKKPGKKKGVVEFANRVVTLDLGDDMDLNVQTFSKDADADASRSGYKERVWSFQPCKEKRNHIARLQDAFSWAIAFGYFSQTDKTGRLLKVTGFEDYGNLRLGHLNGIWVNSGVIIVFKHEITKQEVKRYMYRSPDWSSILWYSPTEHNWVIAKRGTPTKYLCRTKNSDVKYPSDLRKGTVWTIVDPLKQTKLKDTKKVHMEAYVDLASTRSSRLLRPMGGTLRKLGPF